MTELLKMAVAKYCLPGLLCFALLGIPVPVLAQSNVAATAEEDASAPVAVKPMSDDSNVVDIFSITPQEMLKKGKWPVAVLFALSGLLLALVIYLLFVLRMRNVTPPSFLRDVEVMIRAGRFTEARKACSRNKSPAAVMTMAGLDYLEQSGDHPDMVLLKETIESEGSRQAKILQMPTKYLTDIASLAPLIGLFGTILGMYGTFSSVENLAEIKPAALAYGVGQALMTTLVGLMVAIPALMFYAWFRNRATRLITNLEIVGADLLTLFMQKR